MPNDITNELVFHDLSLVSWSLIIDKTGVAGDGGHVDFQRLLPIPINCWMGNVGTRHDIAFKNTALDWCKQNWGTKWNAYNCRPVEPGKPVRLVFDTVWRPPYGWLAALFNTCKVAFSHNWFDEGDSCSHLGKFYFEPETDTDSPEWREEVAPEAEYRRMLMQYRGEAGDG